MNNITEEDYSHHSSIKTIGETHKGTNFEFKLFTVATSFPGPFPALPPSQGKGPGNEVEWLK